MKRKQVASLAIAYCTRSKKPKLLTIPLPKRYSEKYISATKTRNFMLNDSLVDWLKLYSTSQNEQNNKNCSSNPPKSPQQIKIKSESFNHFIMTKGIEFEKELVKFIHNNCYPVVSVSEHITNKTVKKTIDLMKVGIPIIHSAPVRNTKNKTCGIIDLLVRSDYLHRIVNNCPLTTEEQSIPSPKLCHNFHYLVIDIKFSTLPLRADGRHILNSGSYPAYKAQCLIYNDAVGNIQGYTPQYAFILGRRWGFVKKGIKNSSMSCLSKLGVIDYKTVDKEYVHKTANALKWVRENEKDGHQWSISPPSRPELFPNMCYDSGEWQKHKEKIANEIGEITSIWYCGIKHRNIGIDAGITSWRDSNCTSDKIGMRGARASVIDRILDINRQDVDKIRPQKINSNIFDWRTPCNEMFVDFETLSDIFSSFSDLPIQKHTEMIFMIGVWYKENQHWTYKRFTCNQTTPEEEYRIMDEFSTFVVEHGNPKLWYWCAEKSFWNRAENRQFNLTTNTKKHSHIDTVWDISTLWADMCELFKQEPIVIKDCFKFGLKPVSKAMQKHNLITTKLDSNCTSGMTAMVNAWKCYKESPDPANCDVMQDISKYNKFDVCVLENILSYLRKNH